MGKYDVGILGSFIGKIGTVVGSKWRDIYYMRSKGPSRRKNNSPAQVEQQAKFALAVSFTRRMRNLFKVTYKNYTQRMTARNSALAVIVSEAVTGTYPNYEMDFSKVQISRGGLEQELSAAMSIAAGVIQWQWTSDGDQNGGNPRDKTVLVVYCPFYKHCLFKVFGPERSANTASLNVNSFMGQTVYTWLAFISEDGSELSDSQFTGEVVVS